jgi:DNA-binding NarL/FixJ family response regulator
MKNQGLTISPWKLTSIEANTMDAVCKHGSQKGAARALNISVATVKDHCRGAGKKIEPKDRLTRYLKWDRWRHGVQP